MSRDIGKGPSETLIGAVETSLTRAARFNPGDVVPPAAVLWTDADGQWTPLVEQLREMMPQLLTLGEYSPETKTGPAIWLRCVIDPRVRAQKFPELVWPIDAIPVIYMPGTSRQTLRAIQECPDDLKPMVEIQYRGTLWTQKNGKDWTVRAFLISDDGGLGLDVAEDRRTLQSVLGALTQLAVTPTARLRGKRLEAEDFDRLMIGDTTGDLLRWLSDPKGMRERWDDAEWTAFQNRCREEYGFNPEEEGELIGGEKLGKREGPWLGAWERFKQSPGLYPGIPDVLRRAKPAGELVFEKESWPDENESMENSLREALVGLGSMNPAEARERLEKLETEHGARRSWVWARLGMCNLANALEHLVVLARTTASTLGGDSVDVMATLYTGGGYKADDAALRALDSINSAKDRGAVREAIKCIYLPWLEDTARHFQQRMAASAFPMVEDQGGVEANIGECILFVDGLRFDIAERLVLMADDRLLEVSRGWRWAALPTVTITSKPAVSPIVSRLQGGSVGSEFCPEIAESGNRLNPERFRKLLSAVGYQVLGPLEIGEPGPDDARAWTEYGEFDKLGHMLQTKLASQVDDQLRLLLERVQSLLEAGWRKVRVVTDHGWLLVPGGLPKTALPEYLAESRWARCASIKESSHVEVPIAGWSWNPQEDFAYAPGVSCFAAGQEFAHGGASLQECIVSVLEFTSTAAVGGVAVKVSDIRWVGLRCRVSVEPALGGLLADLRTKPNVKESSIAQEAKNLDSEGKAALLVKEDSLIGATVSLVIVDSSGRMICKEATTVGGDE